MAFPRPAIARAAWRLLALALPALVLAGCAGSTPLIPERPGLYAVTGAEGTALTRLGGARGERWAALNDLPADSRFIVAAPGLGQEQAAYPERVALRAAAWVRSEIGPDGDARPVTGKAWAVPELESYRVPVAYEYVGTRAGMDVIQLVPESPLDPGLYKLTARIPDARDYAARLGIVANGLDRRAYAKDHCVDRLIGRDRAYRRCDAAPPADAASAAEAAAPDTPSAGGAAGGASASLDPAKGARAAPPGAGLEIRGLTLERVRRATGPALLIRGQVTNTADARRPVPRLRGRLLGPDGAVLQSWTFTADARRLEAGASAPFSAVRDLAGDGRRTVRVTFRE